MNADKRDAALDQPASQEQALAEPPAAIRLAQGARSADRSNIPPPPIERVRCSAVRRVAVYSAAR